MKRILSCLFLIASVATQAQEKLSFQSPEGIVEFHVSTIEYFVRFKTEDKEAISRSSKTFMGISESSALIKIEENSTSFNSAQSLIGTKFQGKVSATEPVLVYKDGIRQICTGEIIIKLIQPTVVNDLFKNQDIEVRSDEFVKDQYLVKLVGFSTSQIFALVNQLSVDKRVEFAEPNFIRLLKPHSNDPFYGFQWSMDNQGYLGGTVDADMDVAEAWATSTGQNIKVAIIDEGVDLTHNDLTPNLLPGYDATGLGSNGAPNENTNDAHGTNCAGIVAAVGNNGIGVAGVAYGAKIIPVRIAYGDGQGGWITSNNIIAAGINWARITGGADVMSNSWGGGSISTAITNAINDAATLGRGGKGSIVLFATGNANGPEQYPSTLSNVIAVGATSMCDQRKSPTSCDLETFWGSNYGSAIDVAAPGVKIYSTDISGGAGYVSGDYFASFNGTSSACPNAAGVVALMLSVNSQLTRQQVYNILTSSADKVGGYTYTNGRSNELGYGRINACNAVKGAIANNLMITGPTLVCTSAIFAAQVPGGSNYPAAWVSSNPSGLTIDPVTGVATVVNNFSGLITISATLNSQCTPVTVPPISIWVGIPDIHNSSNVYAVGYPGNPVTLNVSTMYQFAMGSVQGANTYTWQIPKTGGWSLPNGAFGNPNNIQTGNVPNGYQLICKPGNACGTGGHRALYVNLVTGGGGMLMASPNPVDDFLTVELDPLNDIDAQVDLINHALEIVFSRKVKAKEVVIETKVLQDGPYVLRITTEDDVRTTQIVVRH